MEAGEHNVLGGDPVRHPGAHVADESVVADVANVNAGRLESDTDGLAAAVESVVIEPRKNDIVHRMAGRNAGKQRTHQQTRKRGIAVGEVINIGFIPLRRHAPRQAKTAKAGIAEVAHLGRGNRIASKPEKTERASLETVGNLFAATANAGQI